VAGPALHGAHRRIGTLSARIEVGRTVLVRYADDFVMVFEREEDVRVRGSPGEQSPGAT